MTRGRSTRTGGIAGDRLQAFVERIERMEEEKAACADDLKAIYAEAKADGFDTKVMRQVVRLRRIDQAERLEQEAILDLYMHALGMIPLDEAAEAEHSASRKGKAKSAAREFVESVAEMGGATIEAGDTVVEIRGRRKPTAAEAAARDPVGFDLGDGV